VAEDSNGVLHSINTHTIVKGSTFRNNKALKNDAGVMFLECNPLSSIKCNYDITDSTFDSNSAVLNGGAIKYNFYEPFLLNNKFNSNSAKLGNDVSSFAVELKFYPKDLEIV